MKNTFGNAITLTLFGESHGTAIGCVLDGLAPGMDVSEERIGEKMALRRPQGAVSTARREPDPVHIVSGVRNHKTTGTPLCIVIPNMDQHSKDYEGKTLCRPGHADLTAEMKYHGFQDPRGGGHFSGRITAPLVAAGAILGEALEKKGIFIGTHVHSIGGICDRAFGDLREDIKNLSGKVFATLSDEAGKKMEEAVLAAKAERDSVGGVLETAVIGMPCGVGEPWFDTVEGVLSHALFSIPAVKGVEFGDGFALAKMRGSESNDAIISTSGETTRTNRCGGILGGITNGMPLLFRTAIKPTPTIGKEQDTVDLVTGEKDVISSGGRHDPCIVHRARIVQDSVTALVLADALALRFGTDFFAGEKK